MPSRRVLRDIRYDPEAQQACDDACEVWLRADEQISLLEWTIVRDPQEGIALTESGQSRALTLHGMVSNSAPTVTFVYEIEPHVICVKAAKFDDPTPIN
jgi:hypothetical protein